MQVIKYVFQPHGDERGQLVALEEFKDIPFTIKRVYYMYDTADGVTRGYHAHKSLQQILICMEQMVKSGDVITMSVGCRHTVLADTELKLIEVQLGKAINVHDK